MLLRMFVKKKTKIANARNDNNFSAVDFAILTVVFVFTKHKDG